MAIWASYTLALEGDKCIVTVSWRTTQAGAIIHTDVKPYVLTDPTVNPTLIQKEFLDRAQRIAHAVSMWQAIQQQLGANQNVVFQVEGT